MDVHSVSPLPKMYLVYVPLMNSGNDGVVSLFLWSLRPGKFYGTDAFLGWHDPALKSREGTGQTVMRLWGQAVGRADVTWGRNLPAA